MDLPGLRTTLFRFADFLGNMASRRGGMMLVLLGLACPFVLHGCGAGKVDGDGAGYYVYVRAFVVNRDFRLHESDRVATESRSTYLQGDYLRRADGNGGRVYSQYPVGPSLLWLPGVGFAHLILKVLHGLGFSSAPPADGFSLPYRVSACWMTIVAGIAGVIMCWRLACSFVAPLPALLGIVGMWFGTNLFFYMSSEPSMSEVPNYFAITMVFWLWWRIRSGGGVPAWFGWGASIGLAVLMRLQNGVLIVLPFMEAVMRMITAGRGRKPGLSGGKGVAGMLLASMAGAGILLAIQLLVWKAATGGWSPPHYSTGIEDWTKLDFLPLLFSARHGLISTHPLWLFGSIGFVFLARKGGAWWAGLAGFLLFTAWLNQLPFDFWAGHSFGARRFVPLALVCGLGLAYCLDVLIRRYKREGILAAVFLVGIFIVQSQMYRKEYRRSATVRDFAPYRHHHFLNVIPPVYRLTGWPFSWPANIIWAVRWGTTPDRYDWGSSLFVDNGNDFAVLDPRGNPVTSHETPYLDFSSPRASHVLEKGWKGLGPEGAIPDGNSASVWINFCRIPTVSGGVLVLNVPGKGGPRNLTVRINEAVVASIKLVKGRNRAAFNGTPAGWNRGTNRLDLEFDGDVSGTIVKSLELIKK